VNCSDLNPMGAKMAFDVRGSECFVKKLCLRPALPYAALSLAYRASGEEIGSFQILRLWER
jgi:hypothetical protein